ncbi:hypothetical protein [Streptomyces sp. NPDC002671]
MQAYSNTTRQTYPSWEKLLAAEASGFAVVILMRQSKPKTGKTRTFTRTVGPFADQKKARSKAAALRRRFARAIEESPGTDIELISVRVEPLWNDLVPSGLS